MIKNKKRLTGRTIWALLLVTCLFAFITYSGAYTDIQNRAVLQAGSYCAGNGISLFSLTPAEEAVADAVYDSIEDLKSASSITRAKVDEVRAAYDALNREQKIRVTNYADFVMIESRVLGSNLSPDTYTWTIIFLLAAIVLLLILALAIIFSMNKKRVKYISLQDAEAADEQTEEEDAVNVTLEPEAPVRAEEAAPAAKEPEAEKPVAKKAAPAPTAPVVYIVEKPTVDYVSQDFPDDDDDFDEEEDDDDEDEGYIEEDDADEEEDETPVPAAPAPVQPAPQETKIQRTDPLPPPVAFVHRPYEDEDEKPAAIEETDDYVLRQVAAASQIEEDPELIPLEDEIMLKTKKMRKSFLDKVALCPDQTKLYYSDLKNQLMLYKKVKSRVTKTSETFKYRGQPFLKLALAGKRLKAYLALDPNAFDAKEYNHKDVSEIARYGETPMLIRIGNARALKRAKALISRIMEEKQLELKKKPINVDYVRELTPLTGTILGKKGLSNLVMTEAGSKDAKLLKDKLAGKCVIIEETAEQQQDVIKGNVSIGEISDVFISGETVDLKTLKKKRLIKRDVNNVTITSEGSLDKKLTVRASMFDIEAVKMILLTGGTAIKILPNMITKKQK